MAAPSAYARRTFPGATPETTITGSLNSGVTSATIADDTGWPSTGSGQVLAVISAGNSDEEKVFFTRSGTTLTLTRAQDGTSDVNHSAGVTIAPCVGARDLDEANYTVVQTVGKITAKGDLLVGSTANTIIALNVGTDGFPLLADSGETSGLIWGRITATGIAASVAGNGLAGGAGTALSVNVDDTGIEINSDTLRLKDSGVVTAKINNAAVTTAKLNDAAVTAAKLAAAVAGAGLAGGAGTALSVSVDDTTIEVATDTLQVKDGGIDEDALAASVAGSGLSGGAGSALSVNVDDTGIEINSDTLRLKDAGVAAAKLDPSLPLGFLDYAEKLNDSSSVTSLTEITDLTITFTPSANRRIKISWDGHFAAANNGNNASITLRDDTPTSVHIWDISDLFSSLRQAASGFYILDGTDGSELTFSLWLDKVSGTGGVNTEGTALRPFKLMAEDIGPAS